MILFVRVSIPLISPYFPPIFIHFVVMIAFGIIRVFVLFLLLQSLWIECHNSTYICIRCMNYNGVCT